MRIGSALALGGASLALAAIPLAANAEPATRTAQPAPSAAQVAPAGVAAAPAASTSLYCVSNGHGAQACFAPYGDKIYVKDTKSDGYSAVGWFRTDYGRSSGCRNSHGAGTWAVCNFNMREGHKVTLWAVDLNKPTNTWRYWSAGRTLTI
jgi:hypothetical protein